MKSGAPPAPISQARAFLLPSNGIAVTTSTILTCTSTTIEPTTTTVTTTTTTTGSGTTNGSGTITGSGSTSGSGTNKGSGTISSSGSTRRVSTDATSASSGGSSSSCSFPDSPAEYVNIPRLTDLFDFDEEASSPDTQATGAPPDPAAREAAGGRGVTPGGESSAPGPRPPPRRRQSENQEAEAEESGSSPRLWRFLGWHLRGWPPGDLIQLLDRQQGLFLLSQPEELARLWGQIKRNSGMTYEKFSRGLRYYYKTGILIKVRGKLKYRFNTRSPEWRYIWEMTYPPPPVRRRAASERERVARPGPSSQPSAQPSQAATLSCQTSTLASVVSTSSEAFIPPSQASISSSQSSTLSGQDSIPTSQTFTSSRQTPTLSSQIFTHPRQVSIVSTQSFTPPSQIPVRSSQTSTLLGQGSTLSSQPTLLSQVSTSSSQASTLSGQISTLPSQGTIHSSRDSTRSSQLSTLSNEASTLLSEIPALIRQDSSQRKQASTPPSSLPKGVTDLSSILPSLYSDICTQGSPLHGQCSTEAIQRSGLPYQASSHSSLSQTLPHIEEVLGLHTQTSEELFKTDLASRPATRPTRSEPWTSTTSPSGGLLDASAVARQDESLSTRTQTFTSPSPATHVARPPARSPPHPVGGSPPCSSRPPHLLVQARRRGADPDTEAAFSGPRTRRLSYKRRLSPTAEVEGEWRPVDCVPLSALTPSIVALASPASAPTMVTLSSPYSTPRMTTRVSPAWPSGQGRGHPSPSRSQGGFAPRPCLCVLPLGWRADLPTSPSHGRGVPPLSTVRSTVSLTEQPWGPQTSDSPSPLPQSPRFLSPLSPPQTLPSLAPLPPDPRVSAPQGQESELRALAPPRRRARLQAPEARVSMRPDLTDEEVLDLF